MTASGQNYLRHTLACLIIDDPLLRPKYGSLNYDKLLEEMKIHNFFTEIAFIPWNYRRSHTKTVRLFIDNPDYYAICVHGCNHTSNEFGVRDIQKLSGLSSTALWRMEQHKKITGLAYDPVMVFPQGHFSSAAMKVLKDHGYQAACNSTLRATDGDELPPIEYQRAATSIYHDFPLFLRRYPKDRRQFVQDIDMGRPIIIVEHPSAFREGYEKIAALVDWINSLGNIKWTSLLHISEHYLGEKSAINVQSFSPSQSSLGLKVKVALRRFFSEARDKHVETSGLLTKLYKILHG